MNLKIYNEMQNILHECPSLINDKDAFAKICSVRFGVDVYWSDIDRITQAIEEHYFTKVWQPKTKKYKYSGLAIVDEINNMNPEHVLDVGCGYNEFKGKINNLTGIDPYNDKADVKCGVMQYEPEHLFDVLICFGSINFGNVQKVFSELKQCVQLTKGGGLLFFRVNPGIQHDPAEAKWIEFFNWSPEFIYNSAIAVGCSVINIRQDDNRIYFVLKKDK